MSLWDCLACSIHSEFLKPNLPFITAWEQSLPNDTVSLPVTETRSGIYNSNATVWRSTLFPTESQLRELLWWSGQQRLWKVEPAQCAHSEWTRRCSRKISLQVSQEGSGDRHLPPTLTTWVQFLELPWWKERSDPHKLSFDLHKHAYVHAHTHTFTHLINQLTN